MAGQIDMTSGNRLTRAIVMFAIPVVASGVLQQSFNSVDVAVVGRFVGAHALAAVGANTPVIGLIVNLFVGISIGANVVVATALGQRNDAAVRRAVATSAVIAGAGGLLLLILGLGIARPMLEMMGTPADVLDPAVGYLRLFALGMPGLLIYNFGSAILRSIGDTRRPFYWLVAGGIVNVCLNLLTVIVFDMGVNGVAVSTAVANTVSAAGVTLTLVRERSAVHLDLSAVRVWRPQLSKILRIGVPAGVQGMVFALSNVFIQSAVNSYGSQAMAGSAAAVNYEFYCYYVMSAFVQAAVAFISQNYGAGNYARCRAIFRRCMALSLCTGGLLNLTVVVLHGPAIALFTDAPSAVAFADQRLYAVLAWQWIACSYEVSGGSLRALGYSMTPTVFTIIGTCLLRVVYVTWHPFQTFSQLMAIYPVSWLVTGAAVLTAWLILSRRRLAPSPQ